MRTGPWFATQPRRRCGRRSAGGGSDPDPGSKRWRFSRTTPTSGMSTTPNCGLTIAAIDRQRAAPSALPRISAATPSRMTSAPAASVWPHSAESYQVTGLKTYIAAAASASTLGPRRPRGRAQPLTSR